MSDDLNSFLKILADGKKQKQQVREESKASLGDFLSAVSEQKAKDPKAQMLKEVRKRAQEDIAGLFGQLKETKPAPVIAKENPPPPAQGPEIVGELIPEKLVEDRVLTEVIVPEVKPASEQVPMDIIDKYIKQNASFQQPNPDPVDPTLKAIQDKLKFMEQWIGKIAATGPGGGEVNLRWLDDVDRPTIYDMRYLRYNDSTKKFEFAEVNPHDVVYTTYLVESPTYTVSNEDYYVGVNYNGPTTITLPSNPSSGRVVIIKDESGNAETNPITVVGNVDNDSGGFIIQINNGAVQMIYRNGWRII